MNNDIKNLISDAIYLCMGDGDHKNVNDVRMWLNDLYKTRAVLVTIHTSYAEWILEDGKKIFASCYDSHDEVNTYKVFDDLAFRKWISTSREALISVDLDPEKIQMPGWISVSHSVKLITGWQEDYTDNGSKILAMCEIMNE